MWFGIDTCNLVFESPSKEYLVKKRNLIILKCKKTPYAFHNGPKCYLKQQVNLYQPMP